MSNPNPIKRIHTPPAWIFKNGQRKQLEKSRWNKERIAEVFAEEPSTDFTVDDLARLVYGSNGKRNRENVRKHIPAQRNHMLARLTPIVTRYGPRGRIMSVKFYDKHVEEDRRTMLEELDRLKLRRELTEDRYQHMCGFLGLAVEAGGEA